MEISISLPIYWEKTFKTKPSKKILLSINWFRNANYFDLNRQKKEFSVMVAEQLKNLNIDKIEQFTMEYIIYYKNKNSDPSNIVSLIEKVTLDALQENNVLVNDNFTYHLGSSWTTKLDKENPRCEIIIKGIKNEK